MSEMNRGTMGLLRGIRDAFYAQKYRFDLGIQFLVFINFALLVVTASDKLKPFLGIENTGWLVVILIPSAFVGVFVFGYFLDVLVKQQQRQEIESGKRSVLWQQNFREQAQILQAISELRKELKKKR